MGLKVETYIVSTAVIALLLGILEEYCPLRVLFKMLEGSNDRYASCR